MSGITALCDLGGASLAKADLAALGLGGSPGSFAGQVIDQGLHPLADTSISDQRTTLLLGWPAGAEFGAACEVLPGKVFDNGRACQAMQRLVDRFGLALTERVDGEWLLLDWRPGQLLLAQSRARRDWLFMARDKGRVALSGDIERIAALSWVGREFDPLGIAAAFGRTPLRAATSQRTILPGVQRLEPGEVLVLGPGGEQRHRAELPSVQPWQGNFAEALDTAQALLRRIIGERLAVAGSSGLMLSGGLDSSTLAALIADHVEDASAITTFTSVAPDDGGLADERAEAQTVAAHMGFSNVPVVPDPDVSVYRPSAEIFPQSGGPTLSPRHYLYRALCAAARNRGVTTLFAGAYGELTLTCYMPIATPRFRLRQAAKRWLGRGANDALDAPYHVRLAPHRMAALRPVVEELVRARRQPALARQPVDHWGWMPGFEKSWEGPTLFDHGLRCDSPFRDPRLLALFAGFPARFLVQDGLNRAPARAMMAGRLPDSIRLRRTNGAFSPDYMLRIRTQAHAVLGRFAAFRQAGADDWIDLVWLEAALQRVGAKGAQSIAEAFEVQLTAMAAEFMVWWRSGG